MSSAGSKGVKSITSSVCLAYVSQFELSKCCWPQIVYDKFPSCSAGYNYSLFKTLDSWGRVKN